MEEKNDTSGVTIRYNITRDAISAFCGFECLPNELLHRALRLASGGDVVAIMKICLQFWKNSPSRISTVLRPDTTTLTPIRIRYTEDGLFQVTVGIEHIADHYLSRAFNEIPPDGHGRINVFRCLRDAGHGRRIKLCYTELASPSDGDQNQPFYLPYTNDSRPIYLPRWTKMLNWHEKELQRLEGHHHPKPEIEDPYITVIDCEIDDYIICIV
jgi:hypothetical protein